MDISLTHSQEQEALDLARTHGHERLETFVKAVLTRTVAVCSEYSLMHQQLQHALDYGWVRDNKMYWDGWIWILEGKPGSRNRRAIRYISVYPMIYQYFPKETGNFLYLQDCQIDFDKRCKYLVDTYGDHILYRILSDERRGMISVRDYVAMSVLGKRDYEDLWIELDKMYPDIAIARLDTRSG